MIRFVAAVLVAVAFLANAESAAAKAGSETLVVRAKHSVFGEGTLYFANGGIKIVNDRFGRLLICKAPDWKFAVFDKDTRKFCVESAEAYTRHRYTNYFAISADQPKILPASTGVHAVIAGIPVTKFASVSREAVRKQSGKRGAEYWVAESLGFPPALYDAFSDCGGLPRLPGLIIRVTNAEGQRTVDTFSARREQMGNEVFNYPSGYKETNDMQSVLFSSSVIKDVLGP